MTEEMKRQIVERARKYSDEYSTGNSDYKALVDGYIAGAIEQYEIDGGETVLKEMRKTILGKVKEWLGDVSWFAELESYLNKLWEEKK